MGGRNRSQHKGLVESCRATAPERLLVMCRSHARSAPLLFCTPIKLEIFCRSKIKSFTWTTLPPLMLITVTPLFRPALPSRFVSWIFQYTATTLVPLKAKDVPHTNVLNIELDSYSLDRTTSNRSELVTCRGFGHVDPRFRRIALCQLISVCNIRVQYL